MKRKRIRYTISNPILNGFSVPRKTAVGAIKKAAQLTDSGLKDVQITDTDTGRAYGHDELPCLRATDKIGGVRLWARSTAFGSDTDKGGTLQPYALLGPLRNFP